MEMVRIGMLGSARIAETALLDAARQVPEVNVAAVAARELARAEAYALGHGIARAYGSYDELLADPDIEAVYNPLPNSLHGPWTLRAIAAGKHVLCEKPFASNTTEANLVAEAAEAAGLTVMEAMHYRYHPLIHRFAEVVRTLGPVRHIQCWTSFVIDDPDDIRYDYTLAGGALMDGGCYALDCMRLLAGEPTVTAALADTMPDGVVDRAIAARLAFPDGAAGWFESAFTRDGEFRADVHVSCEKGTAWVRNFIIAHEGRLEVTRQDSKVVDEVHGGRGGSGSADGGGGAGAGGGADAGVGVGGDTTYAWQLRAFVAAIRTGEPVQTSAAHAVTTMKLIDDVYRAAGLPPR